MPLVAGEAWGLQNQVWHWWADKCFLKAFAATPFLKQKVLFNNNACLWVFGLGPHKMDSNVLGAKKLLVIAPLLLPLLMAPTPTPQVGPFG
jgi:hypothetical protein